MRAPPSRPATQPADPRRDRTALLRLARWCGRYGPNRNIDGDDGLWIDITGVAHLYGGEEQLLRDLIARLSRFKLTVRAGLADTLGAAHALARFAPSPALAEEGRAEARLAGLPIEALRLAPETVLLLKRLGLRRIGELYRLPRAALQRRFRSAKGVEAVLMRLDQALGVRAEPRRPLIEPPALFVQRSWPDPLISAEQLEAETAVLAQELCAHLSARGLGARRLCLSLYRADGTVAEARAGLSAPSWAPEHMTALHRREACRTRCRLRRRRHGARRRAGGKAGRPAGRARPASYRAARAPTQRSSSTGWQTAWVPPASAASSRGRATFPSGPRRRSRRSRVRKRSSWPLPPDRRGRRCCWSSPEPIRVVAEVPEGPPASFVWRRVERRIVKAQGPQRIAPEWWDEIAAKKSGTRDYYRIEDEGGAGYWVFREGLYGRDEELPRWFLHGLFG